MRVYAVMSVADAHVDPIFGVFENIEKAEKYIKEIIGDGEAGWTDEYGDEADAALEWVQFEVK